MRESSFYLYKAHFPISQNSSDCQDFGSFQGTKQGTPFKDPCKPNVTIDKIELTVSKAPVMIRSLKTTYRYYDVKMHLYTCTFKLHAFIIIV